MNNSVVYYPGRFSPPTVQHLNTAQYLTRRENIYEVVIVLGKDQTDQILQDDKVDLWKMLLSSEFATNIHIEQSEDATALMYVYNKMLKHPTDEYYIAIDEASGRKESFTKHFDKFTNLKIELIPSQFESSSKGLLKAIAEEDESSIKKFLPASFTPDQINSVIEILKPDVEGPQESSNQLMERVVKSFDKNYWKHNLNIV